MVNFPYVIQGKVYDTDGTTVLSNIKVTARNENSNKTISANTDTNGDYLLDAANFEGGYNDGDIVTLFVLYTNSEDYEQHTIVASKAGITGLNLTLVNVPASDQLRYFTVQDFYDHLQLTAGSQNTPGTATVVKVGVQAEEEIDHICQTRYSDGTPEVEVTDCDSTTGWSGSTDAVAIAVTTTAGDFRTRTGALDLGKSGTSEALFTYSNSTLTSRSFENRYIACWVYLASLSALVTTGAAVTLRYGSSSSNYYQKTWYKDDLITGWNLLFFKSDDDEVTTTGSPTASAMTYFLIRFDTVAASTTVTSGDYIIDNIFLVHQDHLADEYLDTKSDFQWDYFVLKTPISRTVRVLINRGEEGGAPLWDELTEDGDEIKVDKDTGRVRILDVDTTLADARTVFPKAGAQQLRVTYIFGQRKVPKDIRKLAILMTARDITHGVVAKSLMQGQDSFRSEHFVVFDKDIELLLSRYRAVDIINV